MDASILISHSDKEQAPGTFKHTWGHHPLTAWCDNTDESLAFRLRPGSAGSDTAADHIAVLTEALAQIPARHRRDVLVTVDGAGVVELTGLLRERPRATRWPTGRLICASDLPQRTPQRGGAAVPIRGRRPDGATS
jgi:hypothetical protein